MRSDNSLAGKIGSQASLDYRYFASVVWDLCSTSFIISNVRRRVAKECRPPCRRISCL